MKFTKNRALLEKIHQKNMSKKYGIKAVDIQGSYIKNSKLSKLKIVIQSKKDNAKHAQVNLDVIKRMHYSDFNLGDDDDFKPEDVIDDDDSDDSILAVYDSKNNEMLTSPKQKNLLNNNSHVQYDEKIVDLKKNMKKKITTSRESKKEFKSVKQHAVNERNNKIPLPKGGRNMGKMVSRENTKSVAYPIPPPKMRSNHSSSKVSQSMDRHPGSKKPRKRLDHLSSVSQVEHGHRGTAKNVNTKILLNPYRRNDIGLSNQKHKEQLSHNYGAPRAHNRSLLYNPASINNTQNEERILKMVDKQIDKGLRAANKSSNYY